MAATDALPVPRKNVAFRVTFPILDADGDLVSGAAALDSERSIDGATFADVTAEATEIASGSGMYFLDLTAAEMNGDTIAIIVKTTTGGAKTTPIVLYPQELGDIRVNVTQWNNAAVAVPTVAGVPEVDQTHIVGTVVPAPATAGIPDVNVREWLDAAVAAATAGTPDVNATRWANGVIPAQGIVGVPEVDVTHQVATLVPTPNVAGIPDTNVQQILDVGVSITGGDLDVNVAAMAANTLNASALALDAVNEIRDSIINDATTFAGGDIDAAISSRATPAQVNAEMLDVLNIDTFVESAGVVAATATIVDMLVWLKTLARNRIQQTSSVQTLRDDAQASDIATAAVSDDATTAVRDEWA